MPNFQKNIQGDASNNVGINREGDPIEEDLHIDGVVQIGNDFGGGNATKMRRSPTTGKLEQDFGSGWQELGGGADQPIDFSVSGLNTPASMSMNSTALTTRILEA